MIKLREILQDKKGLCYTVASQWASDNNGELVHGKVKHRITQKVIEHAWAEKGNKVYDLTISSKPFDKAKYYKLLSAKPIRRYNSDEALINPVKYKNWGPWYGKED